MVAQELALSRQVAFYPDAYEGDFEQFYVVFHKLSRCQYESVDGKEPGITAANYDMCVDLTAKREALTKIVDDPETTVWKIWGEKMAVEDPLPTEGWEISYDNPGFEPFLNPYVLADQSAVKGNVIIIAGGGSTHRNNVVEGYPVAKFFNENGYNAFVLQRRVNPYAAADQYLDLGRAIRYIRHNAEAKGLAATDTIVTCGFSAGGMNILQAIAYQYGHVTPDTVYPDYVCDEVDAESADMTVAIPVYGLIPMGVDAAACAQNPNLPAMFAVAGHKDALTGAYMLPSLGDFAATFSNFAFYLAPDAVHGVGLGTGTRNYVNAFTQMAQWPQMAVNFIESRLGIQPAVYDLNSVEFAW